MTRRRDGQEQAPEVEQPVWVKFSTSFKKELATLDAYSLKVFLYIGLSINFDSGEAYPGVRRIAKDTGMNKDTVTKAIESLEKLGLLMAERREGARTIYKPVQYLSIGTVRPDQTPETKLSDQTGQPEQNCPSKPDTRNMTVRPDRTPETQLSDESLELSGEILKLSGAQEGILHNKNNKIIKQEERDTAQSDFQKIWSNLESLCGVASPDTARLINVWLEKHPPGRILQAIDVARSKSARSPKYVDQVLIGWEANGYPPTRDQQVLTRALKPARGGKDLTTLLLESIQNDDQNRDQENPAHPVHHAEYHHPGEQS